MRNWLLLSPCAILAACAGPHGPGQRPDAFFDDSLFAAPEASTTHRERELYLAKLDWMQAREKR